MILQKTEIINTKEKYTKKMPHPELYGWEKSSVALLSAEVTRLNKKIQTSNRQKDSKTDSLIVFTYSFSSIFYSH